MTPLSEEEMKKWRAVAGLNIIFGAIAAIVQVLHHHCYKNISRLFRGCSSQKLIVGDSWLLATKKSYINPQRKFGG
jgi:hypothetical protein